MTPNLPAADPPPVRRAGQPAGAAGVAAGAAGAGVPAIELRQVSKGFGAVQAVDGVSLTVRRGEFLTLLGPSGCGKTTLLRLIAGFEIPDEGAVWLEGADVTQQPPYRRDVNQVFQSYALFPHLTVRDNIAFGLRMQRWRAAEIATRVAQCVALVALEGCEQRMPHQLSGGQRQRVALARALAPRPAVLLLDEPLAALDARLRQAMQLELKALQRQLGTTFVFVTHDQDEALTMSDRIALIHGGRVEQCDEVHAIYHRPATVFAAEFLGQANVFAAELIARDDARVRVRVGGGPELSLPANRWPAGAVRATVSVRPEKVRVSQEPVADENAFAVRVEEAVFKGAFDRLVLVTPGGPRWTALVANESARRAPLHPGDNGWGVVRSDDIAVIAEPGSAGSR